MYRTVDIKRPRSNVAALFLLAVFAIASAACGKGSTTSPPSGPPEPPTPPAPVATRIEAGPQSVNLSAIGETVQIQATVLDQNGAPMSGAPVSWSSNNTAVASVNATGLVKAVGNGAAQVTARSGNLSAAVAVSVSQSVARFLIHPQSALANAIGDTLQLMVTVFDSRGNAVEGANLAVTWTTDDESIAAVSAEGLVTATGNGTASITARSGSWHYAVNFLVFQTVSRIAITPTEAEFKALNETTQFMAEAFDSNGNKLEGAEFTWSSSDDSVVKVSVVGLVTAVGDGSAEITAEKDGVFGAVTVGVMAIDIDRAVLVRFYETTGGFRWTRNTNWLSDRPLGEWFGVTTDEYERVTELTLIDNNLSGSLPAELGELTRLRFLRLRGNGSLTGAIPGELGLLPDLWSISLSRNNFTGSIPAELGLSASLFTIQLDYNQLTGEIPAELGQLPRLSDLQLNDNQLTGQIPPELGRLTGLRSLLLDWNMLTGQIPPELGRLTGLRSLSLDWNMLTGQIPPTLGNLANVYRLELNHNQLTGTIPPELGNMTGLTELFLDNNMLSGPLPEELAALPDLYLIFVGVNPDLAGPLPRSFLDLDLRYLRLEGTGLCVPADDAFTAWLEGIENRRTLYCQPDIQEQ